MDVSALRALLRPAVVLLGGIPSHAGIPTFCREIGLPVPNEGGSKRERMEAVFDGLDDEVIPDLARTLLSQKRLEPSVRNQVQDLIWANEPVIEVPKRHRREIARALQTIELFRHWGSFELLLLETFVIPEDVVSTLFGTGSVGVVADIYRHFVRNPEDADVEWLFDQLQIFDLSEQRFCRWIEGLASADVQTDVEAQRVIVAKMNTVLRDCGSELRHVEEAGGYPVFALTDLRTHRSRPKNIIFASISKPDIRLSNTLENEIEILSDPSRVLVYDRPVSTNGLLWRDLQEWWAAQTLETDNIRSKKALYRRLQQSLPDTSPPQKRLFDAFFRGFGQAVYELPALLPEVWLHWDPKTVRERGARALLNHRMDFLMLLPGSVRVVIEVDGQQHYADESGRASTSKYAELVASTRELSLSGYEVYRFAGLELQTDDAPAKVKAFFMALFARHKVKVASPPQ